jgi:hypothetical protein
MYIVDEMLCDARPRTVEEPNCPLRLKEGVGVDRKYGRGGFIHRSRQIATIAPANG